MRLIDAKLAQNIADTELSRDEAGTVQWVLSHTPTIEAVPVVHGRWENITIAVVDTTGYCGVCGEKAVWRTRNKPYAICPNCGARMDGGADDA